MRGEVLTFDQATGLGAIRGDDGARYLFAAADVRSEATLKAGQKVEFQATEDRQAREVALVAPPARPAGAIDTFDLGRVIQRTWSTIASNAAVFFGAAVVFVGVPGVLLAFGQSQAISGGPAAEYSLLVTALGWILQFAGVCLVQGVVIRSAADGFNGRSTSAGQAISAGVSFVLPLLGLAIIVALGTLLGYILLIVPGLILSVLWVVAAPALVVEKRGVFESLQRSRDLTRGHRWSVFGLIVIYVLLAWIIAGFLGALGVAAGGSWTGQSSSLWGNILAGPAATVLTGVVASAGLAALYQELRSTKEGAGPEALAAVFD